eukprot:2358343-Rhodomonas_salina.2
MGTGASQPPTPPMKKQPETVPKKKYDDVVKKLEAVQKELQALKMSKGVEQQNTLRDIPHGKVTLGVSAGEKYPAEMTPGKRALECPVAVMTDSYKATHPWIYPEAQSMEAYGEFRARYKGVGADDDRFVVRPPPFPPLSPARVVFRLETPSAAAPQPTQRRSADFGQAMLVFVPA